MPDIRYVCLSDMHLGADDSVLTYIKPGSIETDPMTTSPVLTGLVACLRDLITRNESAQKPTLILNGDILELALADTNQAAMTFERFIEMAFPSDGEPLFDKNMLYLPGNHDHHIWEIARETQFVNYMATIPAGSQLNRPWHTTKMFSPDMVPGYFLTNLIQRFPQLRDAVIYIIYPNYGLLSSDGQRCIVFSHGHYVESLYSLMSTLNTMLFPNRQRPKYIWELEAENFAWIDFFWSTMGRSGDVGLDIGLLYDKLKDQKQIRQLLDNLAAGILEKQNQPRWLEGIEEKALGVALDLTLGRIATLERNQPAQLLSPDAQQGLQWYIEGPLLEQIRQEHKEPVPPDMTFIFGHTHKPFSQPMNFAGYPPGMKVYNSGGWVVDSTKPAPIYGGAVILIDENLHATSLRMYNEALSAGAYAVRVEQAGSAANPFYERIKSLVNPTSDPWKSFSEAVGAAVTVRAQVLETKINM